MEMLVAMARHPNPNPGPGHAPDPAFWRGKRVLLTGHTGFKGAWLALWLQRLGAQLTGLALAPAASPGLFALAGVAQQMDSRFCDLCNARALAQRVRAARPEVVLHLAAQALVHTGHAAPVQTFAANVMGTVHLLDALRGLPGVRVAVVVTTDKVYRNPYGNPYGNPLDNPYGSAQDNPFGGPQEPRYPLRETDALGGLDPYGASKAAAELVVASYRASFLAAQGLALATARAGNAMGGGDWAPQRLLPDAARAWSAGRALHVRQPQATRPWQHVLEALAAYLRLAQCLWQRPQLAGAYNFGPLPHQAASVRDVIELAAGAWPGCAVSYEKNSGGVAEANTLALETAHARHTLGVAPHWDLNEALARTMGWYRQQLAGADARALCLADIAAWEDGKGGAAVQAAGVSGPSGHAQALAPARPAAAQSRPVQRLKSPQRPQAPAQLAQSAPANPSQPDGKQPQPPCRV